MNTFAARRPVVFSVAAIVTALLVLKLGAWGLKQCMAELPARLLAELMFCLVAVAYVSALGWWREIGFHWPKTLRGYAAYLPWLVLPLLVVLGSGVHTASADRVLGYALFCLMVGFAEEVLMRGVVLKVLAPGGVMRAVMLSSLLFGLMHLSGLFNGHALQPSLVQVIYATFIGIGFAGPRLYSGSILPAILLHALVDFADGIARGYTFAAPKEMNLHDAGGTIIVTGLYALYGWWLTRRSVARGAIQAGETR